MHAAKRLHFPGTRKCQPSLPVHPAARDVGWVERSEPHRSSPASWWGSLRSTRPTFPPQKVDAMKFPAIRFLSVMSRIIATILVACRAVRDCRRRCRRQGRASTTVAPPSPTMFSSQVWLISSRQAPCDPPACGGEAMLGYCVPGTGQPMGSRLARCLPGDGQCGRPHRDLYPRQPRRRQPCRLRRLARAEPIDRVGTGPAVPLRHLFLAGRSSERPLARRCPVQGRSLATPRAITWRGLINRTAPGRAAGPDRLQFRGPGGYRALELLGGGCVAGQVLPDRTPGHAPIRGYAGGRRAGQRLAAAGSSRRLGGGPGGTDAGQRRPGRPGPALLSPTLRTRRAGRFGILRAGLSRATRAAGGQARVARTSNARWERSTTGPTMPPRAA